MNGRNNMLRLLDLRDSTISERRTAVDLFDLAGSKGR
jgi:hypothetical protein